MRVCETEGTKMEKTKIGFLALCAPVHVELIDEMGNNLPCCGWAEMAARNLRSIPEFPTSIILSGFFNFPFVPVISSCVSSPDFSLFIFIYL